MAVPSIERDSFTGARAKPKAKRCAREAGGPRVSPRETRVTFWCKLLPATLSPHLLPPDDPAYARLWTASPQRTAFAHPAAVRALADAFGRTARIAAVGEDGDLAAAVPVFEKTRGPVRVAALPPLAPVVSPLLAEPLAEHLVHARRSPLDALLRFLAERYAQASLLLHPSLDDLRPLVWGGWAVTPRYTYAIDLSETDGLAGWSASARRLARGATGDYRIEEDDRHVETAVALMEDSYRRHGEPLGLDGAAVRQLARRLCTDGLARPFAAVSGDGAVEAAAVVAHDGRTAHYWIAGSRPGPAMTVLLAHLLPRLQADGLERFDFVGANTPSIAEFKRRFGPRLVLAPRAVYRRPALRLLHALRGT